MKLTKDNNFGCTASSKKYEKRDVFIDRVELEMEIKKYFKWRKGDFIKRLFALGSCNFDSFINHLIDIGY